MAGTVARNERSSRRKPPDSYRLNDYSTSNRICKSKMTGTVKKTVPVIDNMIFALFFGFYIGSPADISGTFIGASADLIRSRKL